MIVLIGCPLTRAKSFLLGEKFAEAKVERPVAKLQNLAVSVGAAEITLHDVGIALVIPGDSTPCFSSFNVSQCPYSTRVRYGVRVGTERVKGTLADRPLDLLPGVYQSENRSEHEFYLAIYEIGLNQVWLNNQKQRSNPMAWHVVALDLPLLTSHRI